MNEVIDFLKYLQEVKRLPFPRLVLYDDLSGCIEYQISEDVYGSSEDVEIFYFGSIEDLLDKIEKFKDEY